MGLSFSDSEGTYAPRGRAGGVQLEGVLSVPFALATWSLCDSGQALCPSQASSLGWWPRWCEVKL